MNSLRSYCKDIPEYNRINLLLDKIESSLDGNPNEVIECSKAIIETISKSILNSLENINYVEPKRPDFQKLVNEVLDKHPFFELIKSEDIDGTKRIFKGFSTIVNAIGFLRNKNGFISHGGDTIEEFTDPLISELIYNFSDAFGCFLLKIHKKASASIKRRLIYYEHEEFNEWYDERLEPVSIGKMSYPASEALFKLDIETYKGDLIEFENKDS